MKYTKQLNNPKFTSRTAYKLKETINFTPKRLETNLGFTIKMAARMAYKHLVFKIVRNRQHLCNINILYNIEDFTKYIINNNITQMLTVSNTIAKDDKYLIEIESSLKKLAIEQHYPDIHFKVSKSTDVNKISKWKNNFKLYYIRSILDSSIVNCTIMNDMLGRVFSDWEYFIPTFEDMKNNLKYWTKIRYGHEVDLTDITNYIINQGGYDEYYKWVADRSLNIYKVADMFYDNLNKWILHKCRLNTLNKIEIEVSEEDKFKYYDFNTGETKLPVKYVEDKNYIEIYEYGSNRSDRWISVKSLNGKYCLWMPRAVKDAMSTYYHKHGGNKLKEYLRLNWYYNLFDIEGNWDLIKKILSRNDIINNNETLIGEWGQCLMSLKQEFTEVNNENT